MTDVFDLDSFTAQCRERVDQTLGRSLPHSAASPRLNEAMRYCVLQGGKRIRPVLVYAANLLAGGQPEQADIPAAAIELIHAYSLVHDDLPAMDDDDLRRGQPTCHRAYDEATAILAGDTLHSLAFELLACKGDYADHQRIKMIRTLSQAAGHEGMAAGQMQDILASHHPLTLAALEEMHYLKTGRLITASLLLGYQSAGKTDTHLEQALVYYGDAVGLAFQIHDDILDVTGTTEELGKMHGADERLGKTTFPGLIGLEASQARAHKLVEQACQCVAPFPRATCLDALAHYLVSRRH